MKRTLNFFNVLSKWYIVHMLCLNLFLPPVLFWWIHWDSGKLYLCQKLFKIVYCELRLGECLKVCMTFQKNCPFFLTTQERNRNSNISEKVRLESRFFLQRYISLDNLSKVFYHFFIVSYYVIFYSNGLSWLEPWQSWELGDTYEVIYFLRFQ